MANTGTTELKKYFSTAYQGKQVPWNPLLLPSLDLHELPLFKRTNARFQTTQRHFTQQDGQLQLVSLLIFSVLSISRSAVHTDEHCKVCNKQCMQFWVLGALPIYIYLEVKFGFFTEIQLSNFQTNVNVTALLGHLNASKLQNR